ncbi:uncharacterized protein TRAVEDRAFT_27493 [Trametes versicolor FP-101664 SS1]|uniref:uncharacterized protein n=1 Tax=Trametes versicolor (strain FP-101664) TaxID=717944 RepID=UPI0004621463|nr:uncharacterized protein TRAVEDRAFT_27493 [Trametes versicolor FP-101664 SS1]EIW62127.1 hypothetical protein TRAVEDRAFT_27493 [Trametes versicolor FP-101664 SS1]
MDTYFGCTIENLRLGGHETYWRDLFSFLESHGYTLRPRYRPGWEPPWPPTPEIPFASTEDCIGLPLYRSRMIDATRVSDGKLVMLKAIPSTSTEVDICRYFSSEPLCNDPRNRCIPLLDVLSHPDDPDVCIMVMPYLRNIDQPLFDTVEDILECGAQILDGLLFMHEHNVAHRDCAYRNVMMDATAMNPSGYHPLHWRMLPDTVTPAPTLPRSSVPVTYYLIDFGISTRFSPDDPSKLVVGTKGLETTVPELSATVPYDPFKTDIYILGALFRQEFLDKYSNVGMLAPLIASMTVKDPAARPDAAAALEAWRLMRKQTAAGHRQWRAKGRDESLLGSVLRDALLLLGAPAMPPPLPQIRESL